MSTFGDMKTRIADELSRSDLTTQIGLEILTAISHYENQRWWFGETRATASTVASVAYVAMPTDLLDEDSLTVTLNGTKYQLTRRAYDWIDKVDSGQNPGQPSYFAFYQEQIRLYPIPDAVYTLTFSYIKSQTALSLDADTNDWTNAGEALIRARAKAAVRINYLNDAGALQEAQAYALNRQDFLCTQEAVAYRSLKQRSDNYVSTGQIEPWCI